MFLVASNVCLIGLHNSTIISAERAVAFLFPPLQKLGAEQQGRRLYRLKAWLLIEDPRLGVPRAHIMGCTGVNMMLSVMTYQQLVQVKGCTRRQTDRCSHARNRARTHARTHTRTHAHTHARTHALTLTRA